MNARGADPLIRAFLSGERAAIFQLTRWINLEIRSLRSRPADRQREDLIQETLLRLWKVFGRGEFRGRSSLQRYVRAIARYAVLDQLRKKADREVTGEEAGATIVDDTARADERLEDRDLAERVLSDLGEDDGRLLVEAFVLERPYVDMAAERGISHGTLKVRVFRAARRARAGWSHVRGAVDSENAG